METVYSLVYALKKFKYDPDCDLFLGCLDKMLPQDLRGVQPVITNEVLSACRKRDLRVHKETFGFLSLDDLLRALKDVKIFLYKSDEAFLALQVAPRKNVVVARACSCSCIRMLLLWKRRIHLRSAWSHRARKSKCCVDYLFFEMSSSTCVAAVQLLVASATEAP
jgi:hypothetical protein